MHRHGYEGKKNHNMGAAFCWFIFEPQKRPIRKVPLQWVSWKLACRKYPQRDTDAPPEPLEQLGLFA
jgi:hypothetical protein